MKKQLVFSLCLTLLTSAMAVAVEPIGSLGEGVLQQAHFLPDGTILRVMRDRIEIVNPDTNAIIDKFAEDLNGGEVTLSPDGAWMAINTYLDGTRKPLIEIWEIATRKLIRRLEPRSGGVDLIAFSTATPLLAVASLDQIHLWNWADDEYLGEMTGERRPVQNCYHRGSGRRCSYPARIHSLAFSPNGQFLVAGSYRPDAEVWEVSTRQLVGHLEAGHVDWATSASYTHVDWVTHVSYSQDGLYIVTARPEFNWIYLWNAQTRQLIRTLRNGQEGKVRKLLFSSDSQRLYVATQTRNWAVDPNKRNDRVRVFDVQTGAQLNEFGDEFFILEDFSLSPDEKVVLFRYYISEVVLWDVEHNRRLAFWADYLFGYDRELSPDGRSLVMVNGAIMKIWDVPSRSLRKVIVPHSETFDEFAISPDSQTIAIGQDRWIELRDIYTGEVIAQFDYDPWSTIAFSQTGKRIATEHLVLDIGNPENREVLDKLGYSSIAFSAGDTHLASIGEDNLIHLWEQQDGKYAYCYALQPPVEGVLTFIPSLDGTPILAVVNPKQVAVWELRDQPQQLLILELDARWPIHFSGDGRYLFANSEDGLQIWDWREQKRIQHPPRPQYLAISRDSSVLLTWEDKTWKILVWDGRSLLLPEPGVSYDINRDRAVNILDLVAAAAQFGQSGTDLSGDVNGDEKVNESDLELIGLRLGENAAAPSLRFNHSGPTVSYHPSKVKRQFQALTALESLETPSRGAHIARDLLRVWLSRMEPSVTETKLLPNYPNPFNPETWIPYQLSEAAHVRIRIYDVAGHLVRTLDLGTKLASSYLSRTQAAYWDGRNDGGETVSSGIYWYELDSGSFRATRKMVIQK